MLLSETMERRVRGNSHARCGVGKSDSLKDIAKYLGRFWDQMIVLAEARMLFLFCEKMMYTITLEQQSKTEGDVSE